jgi:ribonuclease D
MNTQASLIADTNTLQRICNEYSSSPVLALDTEFIRTNTFYPIPALLQIYDGKQCSLVDVAAIHDLSPLQALLTSPSITKVLHSCSEDLEVFERLLGQLPDPVFDTQIAAAFLGHGFSIGYSRLVKTLFGEELPKDESRSNWLQRPLTPAQILYATQDVLHLYHIYQHFQQQLQGSHKAVWIAQCYHEMLDQYRLNQQPSRYFGRFKSSGVLDPAQREHLFQLCAWRDEEARRRNKPRNHVVRDEQLFEHAKRLTFPKGYQATVLETNCPSAEMPLPKQAGELMKQLKQAADTCAASQGIAPEMLSRKRDLAAFIASGIADGHFKLPLPLAGWRKLLVGDRFLQLAQHWFSTAKHQAEQV